MCFRCDGRNQSIERFAEFSNGCWLNTMKDHERSASPPADMDRHIQQTVDRLRCIKQVSKVNYH